MSCKLDKVSNTCSDRVWLHCLQLQTTGNSNTMELTGMKACFEELLKDWDVNIDAFVTDRHIQIRAYMRENYGLHRKNKDNPYVKHSLDIWHVVSRYCGINL